MDKKSFTRIITLADTIEGSGLKPNFTPEQLAANVAGGESAINEIARARYNLGKALGEYGDQLKEEGHDPSKFLIAELINEKMLSDTCDQLQEMIPELSAAVGAPCTVPSLETLREMQLFVSKFKKRNPFAKEDRIRKACEAHFKIKILDLPMAGDPSAKLNPSANATEGHS